jgi:hypothetical protein
VSDFFLQRRFPPPWSVEDIGCWKLYYLTKVKAVERVNKSQYRLGETPLQETAHVEGVVNVVRAACAALSKLGKN